MDRRRFICAGATIALPLIGCKKTDNRSRDFRSGPPAQRSATVSARPASRPAATGKVTEVALTAGPVQKDFCEFANSW